MLLCVLKTELLVELPVNYNYVESFESKVQKVQNWNYSFHVQVRKFVRISSNESN